SDATPPIGSPASSLSSSPAELARVGRPSGSSRVSGSLCRATFQKRTSPSLSPAARLWPSGENDTAHTGLSCAKLARSVPLATSHSLTIRSIPADARVFPSGENAKVITPLLLLEMLPPAPSRSANSMAAFFCHVLGSRRVTVLAFSSPTANTVPSGGNARQRTGPCSLWTAVSRRVATSHNFATFSLL